MKIDLLNFVSVKDAIELTGIKTSTFYSYLQKGAVDGAIRFDGTGWLVPKAWVERYNKGQIDLTGIYRGDRVERKIRERNRKEVP